MSPFRELLKLFRGRFLESDALAANSGYDTHLIQIVSILMLPGIFFSVSLAGLSLHQSPGTLWGLRGIRLFFTAYSFAVAGFSTVFEWDMLFPERRDFLVLTVFPLKLRDIFAAKLASLGVFVAALAAVTNAGPIVLFLMVLIFNEQARNPEFLRLVLLHITSCAAASAFGFLIVAGLQGLLINLTNPRMFRRISPYAQMIGMSFMVLSLLTFPLYSNLPLIAAAHPAWLQRFPPYWFMGMQEMFGPNRNPLFASLGLFGWKALGGALVLFCATWGAGYARHYRRTLESEDTGVRAVRRQGHGYFGWMLRSPQERAVFRFSGAMLARSTRHRLFLATYLSVGISIGVLVMVTVTKGAIRLSPEGVRAFPLLITFFVVSGFRAGFQFPVELASNWIFQIAESDWGAAARDGARKRVLVSGLLPVLLIFSPVEVFRWGWAIGLMHVVFQAAAGALLIECFFWRFDKVPFTCSYFPGKMDLALLIVFYLYGFTNYAFTMSDLEAWMEGGAGRSALVLLIAVIALAILWRRKVQDAPVIFDAGEPEIQALDLN